MTKQEIESKLQTIRNNKALPDKQKGMLIDKYEKMLAEVSGGEATKVEKPKRERKPRVAKPKVEKKEKEVSPEDEDCDDLREEAIERKKKADAAYEKRKNAPKKSESTKNKEAVEKASKRVEKSVEKRIKSGDVNVSEIEKLIEEYESAVKKLKDLLERVKGKMRRGGSVDPEEMEHLIMSARGVKEHHCGCNDKMARGGVIKPGDMVRSTKFKGYEGVVISKGKSKEVGKGYYFVRLNETLPNGDYQHDIMWVDEVEKLAQGGSVDEYVVVSESKDGYLVVMSTPVSKTKAQELASMTTAPRNEVIKVMQVSKVLESKKVIGKEYLMAKGGWTTDHKYLNKSEDYEKQYAKTHSRSSYKMADGGVTDAQKNKVERVMHEFKMGTLKSSSGQKVTDRDQAIAIALSEAGMSKKMATGGGVDIKISSGEFDGKELWRVTHASVDGIGIYPKKFYTKEEAISQFKKKYLSKMSKGGSTMATGGGEMPKVVISKDDFMQREDEPNRLYHSIEGTYSSYWFKAKTDNSHKFGYRSDGINKSCVYELDVWRGGNPVGRDSSVKGEHISKDYIAGYYNKWDVRPKTKVEKEIVNDIVAWLEKNICDLKREWSKVKFDKGGSMGWKHKMAKPKK